MLAKAAESGFAVIDWVVIVVYILGITLVGCLAGYLHRRKTSHEDAGYFLAGRSLGWVTIGLALFSTNISTVHLVALAQEGYTRGLVYGNYEWMAAFTLLALALFFAPFYIRSKVATLPDFLHKRYNRYCRDYLAIVSILSAIFIHIGFTLYSGSVVARTILGPEMVRSIEAFFDGEIPFVWISIIVLTLLTGLYTIIGGLLAVVLTESIQTIVLLLGAIIITIFAFVKVGGYEEMLNAVSKAQELVPAASFSALRASDDPADLPWYAILLGYPVLGIWYWCTDQTIVQRVLGAKDENNARVGALFAGFIKILPVFIFVLPGLIYLGICATDPNIGFVDKTDDVYGEMILNLLPAGILRGVMAAALLAALMSTVSGALNSTATLFSYDLLKRWRPQTSEKTLVHVGRIVTAVGMILAIIWSIQVSKFTTIFQGIAKMIGFVAPPITAVFLTGVFWKKASSKGALITLWVGLVIGALLFVVYGPIESLKTTEFSKEFSAIIHWALAPFLACIFCILLHVVMSYVFPQEHTEESRKLVWDHPLEALKGHAWRGIGNFRVLAVLLFVVMIVLYLVFTMPSGAPPFMAAKVNVLVDTQDAPAQSAMWADGQYAKLYSEPTGEKEAEDIYAFGVDADDLTTEDLAGRNMLMVLLGEGVQAYSDEEIQNIKSFVSEQGGGLMICTTGKPDLGNANALLNRFGMTLTDKPVKKPLDLATIPHLTESLKKVANIHAEIVAKRSGKDVKKEDLIPDFVYSESGWVLSLDNPADWFLIGEDHEENYYLVMRRMGKGRIVVCSADLFYDEKIEINVAEDETKQVVPNAALVQNLLRWAAAGKEATVAAAEKSDQSETPAGEDETPSDGEAPEEPTPPDETAATSDRPGELSAATE